MLDVLIIGGGVTGCAVARELSRFRLKTCLLEKASDVASGATRANSAIVHAGFDAVPGTLKARFNVRGNAMFDSLARELDFPFIRNGSLVISFSPQERPGLTDLLRRGGENGVPGLEILSREQVHAMEPNLSEAADAALFAPTGGIVCPYEMTVALGENACANGVEFRFGAQAVKIERREGFYRVLTADGRVFETRAVVNAAGLFADELNNQVSARKLAITPRKGEYCLFDKAVGDLVRRTVFQQPNKMGKGVLVTPTVDGNLLIGPSAQDTDDKNDTATTREGLDFVLEKGALSLAQVPLRQIIHSFAGLRAHLDSDDFVVGEAPDAPLFFNCAGIESPGLTSAPAIGETVALLVAERLGADRNPDFNPRRAGIPRFREMSNDGRQALIRENPAYGRIVCRCETVTEGEILDALRRPLGARTLDAVKRRTRAGMGRCQSGFCTTRLVAILSRELREEYTEIAKNEPGSELLLFKDKEFAKGGSGDAGI